MTSPFINDSPLDVFNIEQAVGSGSLYKDAAADKKQKKIAYNKDIYRQNNQKKNYCLQLSVYLPERGC